MTLEWPKFVLAAFSGWNAVPAEVRETMLRVGVPKNSLGRLYSALQEPLSVDVPGRGRLIRFGNAGLSGGIYLDPSNGQVTELIDHPGAVPQLVNTTLQQFTLTVKKVIDMFPFYDKNSELEERTNAAARIAAAIGAIDSSALAPDSFWGTFLDDVVTGDFATQDVVSSNSPN
jgi:SUKH-4 immunity protein